MFLYTYTTRYKKQKHQEQSRNEKLTTAIINGGLLTSDTAGNINQYYSLEKYLTFVLLFVLLCMSKLKSKLHIRNTPVKYIFIKNLVIGFVVILDYY